MSSWTDLGADSMDRISGWLEEDGWWSKAGWAFKLKFAVGTTNIFSRSKLGDVELQDVIQFVTHVEALRLGLGVEIFFDALELNKPSLVEGIDVHLTYAGVESLARAIEAGCLQSLRALRFHNNIGRIGHFTLAKAMTSGGLPSLKALILSNIRLSNVALDYYLGSGQLRNLTCLIVSSNYIGDEGAKSLELAIRSGELKNLAELGLSGCAIGDEGLIALTDCFEIRIFSQVPNLSSLDLSFNNSFTVMGLLSLAAALNSGRLNSLKVLDVQGTFNPSERVATALLSAFRSNHYLTVHVKYEWHKFPKLDRLREQLIKRNCRNRDILAGLLTSPMTSPKVQATFGKVYICGSPLVGKTTLCRSLQRSFFEGLIGRERKPRVKLQTRGIDVSRVSSEASGLYEKPINPITLSVWDMAGQEDFHVLHNAFFPDLGSTEGTATTFLVVCSSQNSQDKSMKQLKWWLRYIASSCDKSIQNPRQVFFVMNNFQEGRKIRAEEWKVVLEGMRDTFEQHLEIQKKVFLIDVSKFHEVALLKSCLLEHSQYVLRNCEIPKICYGIESNLSRLSQQRQQFPVLHWTEFVTEVCMYEGEIWPEEIIDAATKYLNEAGVLIYVDVEGVRFVVVDPKWLCRDIIGTVFLPRDMASQRELQFTEDVDQTTGSVPVSILKIIKNVSQTIGSIFVSSLKKLENVDQTTGSISVSSLKKVLKHFEVQWTDAQVDDMIAILLWLRLCYKGKDENVFIPALMAEKGIPADLWHPKTQVEHGRDQWVMGFSVTHQERELALAPISLWHRFQVDLAQASKFCGQGHRDYDFVAHKYFVTLIVDHVNVLIEVDANLDKPTFEEISILVGPSFEREGLDATGRRQWQVDLANDLVERLLRLWDQVCPGVEYEHRIIWPWPASSSRPQNNPERNVRVAEVKKWVKERGLGAKMQWVVGSGDPITSDQLLSTKDKRDLVQSVAPIPSVQNQRMKEAVNWSFFPPDVLTEDDKEPAMTNEECAAVAHKGIPVAEKDARKFNVTDIDYESSSSVRTPHQPGRDGKQQNFVKDFITEINRGESGYSVSKAWLVSLEEHDKETILSVLFRAGYIEFHQTGTTIMYRRIEDNAEVPTVYNQLAACTTEKNGVSFDDIKQSLASNGYVDSDEIGEEGYSTKTQDGKELGSASQMERSDGLDSEMSTVSSSQKKIHVATVQTDEISRLGSPRSLSHKGNAVVTVSNEKLESFKTALKDTGPYGYAVSTEWLSTLSDHEVEDLKVVLWKAEYLQIGKTNTTTYFKRHGDVHNGTGSQRQAPSTHERNALGDWGRSSTSQCTESDLREELQDLSMEDPKVTSETQDKQRGHVGCQCLPQYLTVTCQPPPEEASPSSSQRVSKHSTRQSVSDCHVTMPRGRELQTMNTGVDKIIELRTIDFYRKKAFVKTVSLDVRADTSLTCCLTSDENDKKVRFEFLKIEGKVEMAESRQMVETMDTNIIPLVLRALRTNVYASTTRAEGSEPLTLRILEPEQFQSIDRKCKTRELVLKETFRHPKNSESGSNTIELQYKDRVSNSDIRYGNYGLRFSDNNDLRVVFEGVVPANRNQNSFLELEIRYQLEICHYEGCDHLPREDPFVSLSIATTPVDFDCMLEFKCKIT